MRQWILEGQYKVGQDDEPTGPSSIGFWTWLSAHKLIAVVLVVVVAGGGTAVATQARGTGNGDSGRSTANFCRVYNEQKEEYLAAYGPNTTAPTNVVDFNDVFNQLGRTMAAFNAAQVLFAKLSDVAPDSIVTNVEQIRDGLQVAIQDGAKAITDPAGGITSSIVTGITTANSWQIVGNFISQNCDHNDGGTSKVATSVMSTLQLVACLPSGPGLLAVDPTTGTVNQTLASRVGNTCLRYPASAGATATLYRLSPDLSHMAQVATPSGQLMVSGQPTAGGVHAGFEPSNGSSSTFTDESGVSSSNFSQTDVEDSEALFNPVSGDLWWVRNNTLMSNTVPAGTPTNRGAGATLYSFTADGQPMPMEYYDSPSGKERAILTLGNLYSGTFNYGPTSSLSSSCLMQSGLDINDFMGTHWSSNICGSQGGNYDDVDGSTSPAHLCNDMRQPTGMAGWINDNTVVCYSNNTLQALTLTSGTTTSNPVNLIPQTTQSIADALVTPDGKNVVFFTVSPSTGATLYTVPTDGSGATGSPHQLGQWNVAGASGALVGWMLPNGKLVE